MHHFTKKTKIVATIGPVTEGKDMFSSILHAGVNVARINMSHGTYEEQSKKIKTIKAVAKKEGCTIGVLLDLAGPKIRIGDFAEGVVELVAGETMVLTGEKIIGDKTRVHFNYPHIATDIKPGMVLMLDDGKKKLEVISVKGDDIYTKVIVGGTTKGRRGVNIPGAYLSIDALTAKDKKDLVFGLEQGVDFVALSFVRTADDIGVLRKLLKKHNSTAQIVAKIETQEAVDHIDAIIEATDIIMVARGDLAIEVGPEKVPSLQKQIIKKCNDIGKPVIVATQMLESMITTPVPTRAEVSDVANAIFDGADAIMLSEETTLGKHPLEAVRMMHDIAVRTEAEIGTHRRHKVHSGSVADSVSSSVVHNAEDVQATVIVALTETGSTPRMIARYKPQQPIITLTPNDHVMRQLLLVYGCYPIKIKPFQYIAKIIPTVNALLKKEGVVAIGDHIVVSAGVPFGVAGSTNMLMVLTVQ
ncbi:MAG: pyruvate kinase [Candidatus Pacebacteria bacterium]|nr:pyruvate kinase [Candidatus Paceibacterota bacterium]MBP9700895.1 pyruvate kinase [Candidatus Paceibacterota bacterium]